MLLGCATQPAQAPRPPEPKAAPVHARAHPAPLIVKKPLRRAPAPEAEPAPLEPELPTVCAGAESDCVPPPEFSERLCQGKFPSLALRMFEKSSPWKRLYVDVEKLEPVNAYGGPRSEGSLQFGEEIVLLKNAGSPGKDGVQVSGANDVDILRWDGTCATVRAELLVSYMPGMLKSAHITWKYLENSVQEALLANPRVRDAHATYRSACRSSSIPPKQCQRATVRLDRAIVLSVRTGMELPMPEKLPMWASRTP